MQKNETVSLAHTISPKFTQNGSQIKAKTIKLLGGNTGAHLYDPRYDTTTQATKEKIDKLQNNKLDK